MSASIAPPDSIDEAKQTLDHLIADATNDPIQGPLKALRLFLDAQQQILDDFASRIEMPVIDEDKLRYAVIQGIEAHARKAVRALNWRNTIASVAVVVVFMVVGFAGGWLVSQNQMVAVPELRGAIVAKDVATWIDVIRLNPNITNCTRLKISDPTGEACALWLKLPRVN